MGRSIVLAGFLWVPAANLAQEPVAAPAGGPPTVVLAGTVSKDDKVSLVLKVPVQVVEKVEFIDLERSRVIQRVEYRTKMVEEVHVVDGKLVSVTRKNGNNVDLRDLPKLLEKPNAVVLFRGKVDPFYVQVLHDNVLIVQVPERQPASAAPPPEEKPRPK